MPSATFSVAWLNVVPDMHTWVPLAVQPPGPPESLHAATTAMSAALRTVVARIDLP